MARQCGELVPIGEVFGDLPGAALALGVTRNNLSRLLNGRIGISARVALGLEAVGWSNAEFWMRLQANYDLAQERRKQAAA